MTSAKKDHERAQEDRWLRRLIDVSVCGACGDAVGSAHSHRDERRVLVQTGTCREHAGDNVEIWPGYDYNRFVELCLCCGAVPLGSGSRWDVWFCPVCREEVDLLNARLGRYALPIGRHSVHAGRLLSGQDLLDGVIVQDFMNTWSGVSAAMRALRAWATIAVRKNVEAITGDPDAVVPLEAYRSLARERVDPADRFREMCLHFGRAGQAERSREEEDS